MHFYFWQSSVDGQKRATTPRGIDSDYSFVIGPGADRKTSSRIADIPAVQETMPIPRIGHDRMTIPTAQSQIPPQMSGKICQ